MSGKRAQSGLSSQGTQARVVPSQRHALTEEGSRRRAGGQLGEAAAVVGVAARAADVRDARGALGLGAVGGFGGGRALDALAVDAVRGVAVGARAGAVGAGVGGDRVRARVERDELAIEAAGEREGERNKREDRAHGGHSEQEINAKNEHEAIASIQDFQCVDADLRGRSCARRIRGQRR